MAQKYSTLRKTLSPNLDTPSILQEELQTFLLISSFEEYKITYFFPKAKIMERIFR